MASGPDSTSAVYDELGLIDELASDLGVADHRPVHRVVWEGDGQIVSGLRWGTEDPALVLLHGGGLNSHSWDAMLLLHDIPALALDLPGHGLSSWFAEPLYVPRALAGVMGPAIAALAPRFRALVGHSLGGLAALAVAAGAPELVERLVIVDATPGSTPERSRDILAFTADTDFESLDEAIERAMTYRPNGSRRALRRAVLHNAHERQDGRWTWRHDTRSHPTVDRWEVMFEELPKGWQDAAALRCPTLLVKGSRSRIVRDADVRQYRVLVDDLQVIEIDDAGHNIHGDQPLALGAAIKGFLHLTGVSSGGLD